MPRMIRKCFPVLEASCRKSDGVGMRRRQRKRDPGSGKLWLWLTRACLPQAQQQAKFSWVIRDPKMKWES